MGRKRDRTKINEWYANRPHFDKWAERARARYGLSQEECVVIYAQENCDICDVVLEKDNKSRNRKVIDHCHETGKVRGVICHDCNIMIGNAKDNIDILQNAIKYLT